MAVCRELQLFFGAFADSDVATSSLETKLPVGGASVNLDADARLNKGRLRQGGTEMVREHYDDQLHLYEESTDCRDRLTSTQTRGRRSASVFASVVMETV